MSMSRIKSRETAFILIFESLFSGYPIREIIETAQESRQIEPDEFAVSLAVMAFDKSAELDCIIEKYLSGWTISRISRVSLAILRIAVCEMLYMDDIPISVSIDRAVELAKKYSVPDDASFINGVLGSYAKQLEGASGSDE